MVLEIQTFEIVSTQKRRNFSVSSSFLLHTISIMSTIPEIKQEEEAIKPQNQQTTFTDSTPENKEASAFPTIVAPEPSNPPTAGENSAETTQQEGSTKADQNQENMSTATASASENKETSTVPEATNPPTAQDNSAEIIQEEEATKAQKKQTTSIATIPESKETSTTPAIRVSEPTNPPTALDKSAQITNSQIQENLSSIPEITAEDAIATGTNPPKDENLAQPKSTGGQETTSSHDVPAITPEEATATPITPKPDNSSQLTNNENQGTTFSSVPEITEYEKTLPTDFSCQSTAEMTDETPKQESTTVSQPQTETTTKDSLNIAPQTNEKTDPAASNKDSICLPLPGVLHRSKEKQLEPKKPALVQDSAITPNKDELPKQSTSAPPTANIPSKDATTKKPTTAQENANISSKDELSKSIEADIKYIEQESSKLGKYKDHVNLLLRYAAESFEELKKVGTVKELRELKKEVTKLKLQIPSKHKGDAEEKDPHKSQISKIRQKNIPELVMKQMPQMHKSNVFESSSEVREFEGLFAQLSLELKLSLLCFSIFPENAIVKKRLMVYWWITEGFVRQIENGKTAEDFAEEYFGQLTKMGFIEPVNKKRSLSVGCYRMHPFVRLALIRIAEKANFFRFDEEGTPTEKSAGTFQACLMGRGLIAYQDLQNGLVNLQDLEKLHAVFNVSEPILDFRPEWFSRMKNLNLLYLGTWKVSATDHIEVEDTKFLDGLSTMEHLRFFSLQGVSRIMELPDSISKLSSLIILDLRACHSLESIPEGIRSLKNLTYLDISECYLLEHMPKGLAMLSNLKVLKGFVVGEEQDRHTCSLDDLAKLEKLIKLSFYTGLSEFPGAKDLKALQRFQALKKLTIAWGGSALHSKFNKILESHKSDNGGQRKKEIPRDELKKVLTKTKTLGQTLKKFGTFKGSAATATSPLQLDKLEKLDLKSFPKAATPTWLMPSSLKSLKKLYIRGGKFSDLGQYQDLDFQPGTQGPKKDTWKVEILRLKYLTELEMDWRQMQELFPNLIYLEKVNCPKLSFFPSDGYGVWINKEKLK